MSEHRLCAWGWGYEDQQPTPEQQKAFAKSIATSLGRGDLVINKTPKVEDLALRSPRVMPPASLAHLCSTAVYDRTVHSYGKAFPDLLRASRGEFPNPPDVVAYPKTEADVVALLDWCSQANAAVTPFGGGSSVTAGVEPPADGPYRGTVTIDLKHLNKC